MSALREFVGRTEDQQVPSGRYRITQPDRAGAASLKMNMQSSASTSISYHANQAASRELAPSYDNNFDVTDTEGLEDTASTILSGPETRVDLEYAPEGYVYHQNERQEGFRDAHVITSGSFRNSIKAPFRQPRSTTPNLQSQSPLQHQFSPSRSKTGRFSQRHHSNSQSVDGHVGQAVANGMIKRARSYDEDDERQREADAEVEDEGMDDLIEEILTEGGELAPDVDQAKRPDGSYFGSESSNLHHVAHLQTAPKRGDDRLDYDDQALKDMTYQQLKDESFDVIPNASNAPATNIPEQLANPNTPVTEKLKISLVMTAAAESEAERKVVMRFYESLSKQQWEQAGDWFLDQFTNILKLIKEARVEKRGIVEKFEDRIAQRQEAVAKKDKAIVQQLEQMKAQGQKVLE